MWYVLTRAAVFGLCSIVGVARAASPAGDQLVDYFLPPDISNAKLSPAGEFVAVIARKGDAYALGVFDLKSGKQRLIGGSRDAQVVEFWWKTPRRLLVEMRDANNENSGYQAVDVDGTNVANIPRVPGFIIDPLPDDPDNVLVSAGGLGRHNIRSGNLKSIDETIQPSYWLLDAKGVPRAATQNSINGLKVWWRAPGQRNWNWQESTEKFPDFVPLEVDQDSRFLIVADYKQPGSIAISRLDTTTGERTVIVQRPDLDPTHVVSLGRSRRVILAQYAQLRDNPGDLIDPAFASMWAKVQAKFAGFTVTPLDVAPDGKTWLLLARNSLLPGAFVLFNEDTGATQMLGKVMGERLPERALAPAEFFTIASRRGAKLSAVMWRPSGVARAPLIVAAPYALPKAPATDHFEPAIQALVASGFAVVDVNTRGTFGFGRQHLESAENDFRAAVADDYEDVIAALVQRNIVDAKRVAIYGEGMGGAMAVYLAVSRGKFAAAVNVNGPVELGQEALLAFSLGRDRAQVVGQIGWKRLSAFANEVAIKNTAPQCGVTALHLYDDTIDNKGLLNESGRRIRKLTAEARVPAQVDVAYSRVIGLKPPTRIAREQAAVAARIVRFLNEAMPPTAAP